MRRSIISVMDDVRSQMAGVQGMLHLWYYAKIMSGAIDSKSRKVRATADPEMLTIDKCFPIKL
jgi:hypothetical protein